MNGWGCVGEFTLNETFDVLAIVDELITPDDETANRVDIALCEYCVGSSKMIKQVVSICVKPLN